ncbi:MAG: TauD/TfdA family dioxygenase [Gammaproteobacteria bacterium]|nr:TauD/TfdA family dioxygenase [Gammaproteobacteria bacterium]
MTVTIDALDTQRPGFAALVSGLNLNQDVPDQIIDELQTAIDRYAVLVFRGQSITDDEQYAFSARFGAMEQATGDISAADERRLSMDINDISNLDQRGQVLSRDDRTRLFGLGNMLWHSDSSFKSVPAKYSLLSARVIPSSGGNTEFADMRAAWSDLDEPTQRECAGLVCEHSQLYSRGILGFDDFTEQEREKWKPVLQTLVRQHPVTGASSLFLSSHIGGIVGWPVPEARMFIRDLTEHATAQKYVYVHRWEPDDLVLWDNRVTMHRARRYDHSQPRDMRRTTVAGDGPTALQATG